MAAATTLRHTYENHNRDREVTKFSKDHEEELVFFVTFVDRRVFVVPAEGPTAGSVPRQ